MNVVAGTCGKHRRHINPLAQLEISGFDKDSGRRFLFVGARRAGEWRNSDGLTLIRLVVLKDEELVCVTYRDPQSITMALANLSLSVYGFDTITLIFHDARKGFVPAAIMVVRLSRFVVRMRTK